MLSKSEKGPRTKEFADIIGSNAQIYLTRYSGLTANESNELRGKIRETGGGFRVINNRLAKRAAEGTSFAGLKDQLTGPIAVAYHKDDPVALAKVLTDFAKTNPNLQIFAGIIDSEQLVGAEEVKTLSKLPGLPELRAQILAMINTPATTLVRLLGTPGTQLARVIDARRESQEAGS